MAKTNPQNVGMPFKRNDPPCDPLEANDFDDVEAQRRHLLPVGKALIFDDFYRSRVMYIGDVHIPDEGKPVYYVYADPETLRRNNVKDYFLDGALLMTTDIFREPPDEQVYGFYIAPKHMDLTPETATEQYRLIESIYNSYEKKHGERARKEAVYSCGRCKRQTRKRHPDDGEILFTCSLLEEKDVNAADPSQCQYFWFDRWFGQPDDV